MRRTKIVCRPKLKAPITKTNGPQLKKSSENTTEPPNKLANLEILVQAPNESNIKKEVEVPTFEIESSQEIESESNPQLNTSESSEKENISENVQDLLPKDTSFNESVIQNTVTETPIQDVDYVSNIDLNSPQSSEKENISENIREVPPKDQEVPEIQLRTILPCYAPLQEEPDEIDGALPTPPLKETQQKQISSLQDSSNEDSQDKQKGKKRKAIDASEAKIAKARETRKNPQWMKHIEKMIQENRKQELKVSDLLFYNPQHAPAMNHDTNERIISHKENDRDTSFEAPAAPAILGPQLKVDENGHLIIDQDSLFINSNQLQETHVYNPSKDFGKKKNSRKSWNDKETLKFYKILSRVGADFALMKEYFPKLTRNQLKNKYSLENRKNPQLVAKTLAKQNFYTDDLEENSESGDDTDAMEYEAENPL